MATLPIITGADTPVLRKKTEEVPSVTKDIKKLISDMEDTVREAQGAGIAGPQVGKSLRLCVALINSKFTPLINPKITWKSDETDVVEEGCLSLPDTPWRNIERPTSIQISYMDLKGQQQERKLDGFDARVVQHELDHLDGVLIVDYQDKPREL